MIAVDAYFDGINVQFLNQAHIKKNQRLIITVMDEFVNTAPLKPVDKDVDKKLAFNKLESLRKKNKHLFTDDFDWKKELEDAIDEKYGLTHRC